TYTVYIAFKQWSKVADALAKDQVLIVEGTPYFDSAIGGMAVAATNVMTKQQKAKNAARNEQGNAEAAARAAANPEAPAAQARPAAAPAPATKVVHDGPPPPEIVKKLAELREAEQDARSRLDEIKAMPVDEQIGL